ncbi:MAG: hypothetical protein NW237_12530 [Cyanobacteriota bacterium]|nr:hypothetical protein [Cyanobacteriota bacterium]
MSSLSGKSEDEKFEKVLGESLLKAGLLTPSQLAQAMWEKAENQMRLEEICLGHGWVTPEQLYSFVPSSRLRLGELTLLYGCVDFEQLQGVIHQQNQNPERKLGEILIEKGLIDRDLLDHLIGEQAEFRRYSDKNAWEILRNRLSLKQIPEGDWDGATSSDILSEIAPTELAEQINHYQQRIQDLEQLVSQQRKFQREAEQSTLQAATFQQQIQQLRQEIEKQQQVQSISEELARQVAGYQQQIYDLQQKIEAQQNRDPNLYLSQTDGFQSNEQQRIKLLEIQLQQKIDSEQTLHQFIADLQNQLRTAQISHQQEQLINQQMTVELSMNQRRIQELELLQTQNRNHLNNVSQQLEDSWLEIQKLQEQMVEKQAQIDKIQSTKARLIGDLAEARKLNIEYQNQLEAQAQITTRFSQEIAALKLELDQQAREKEVLLGELRQAQQQPKNQGGFLKIPSGKDPAAETASEGSQASGIQMTLDGEDTKTLASVTPWVQKVLTHLRLADLISKEDLKVILHHWEVKGEKFTDSLAACTDLKPETIKFFTEEGYIPKPKRSQQVTDYLEASGLVSRRQLQEAQQEMQEGESIYDVLMDKGILKQKTADFFTQALGQLTPPNGVVKRGFRLKFG